MEFFNKEQKQLALKCTRSCLNNLYLESEISLKNCAKSGDIKSLTKIMKNHQLYEYALLFTYTPEYILLKQKEGEVWKSFF